jgi:hypothetical protein
MQLSIDLCTDVYIHAAYSHDELSLIPRRDTARCEKLSQNEHVIERRSTSSRVALLRLAQTPIETCPLSSAPDP